MKVKELIELLQKEDPNKEVYVGSCGGSGKMDGIYLGEECSNSICPDAGILLNSENS